MPPLRWPPTRREPDAAGVAAWAPSQCRSSARQCRQHEIGPFPHGRFRYEMNIVAERRIDGGQPVELSDGCGEVMTARIVDPVDFTPRGCCSDASAEERPARLRRSGAAAPLPRRSSCDQKTPGRTLLELWHGRHAPWPSRVVQKRAHRSTAAPSRCGPFPRQRFGGPALQRFDGLADTTPQGGWICHRSNIPK